ncbi:hypothetical protein KBB68_03755, partial [Candidatus Babeliales bacterium]|nr:hypothetical protein [Candidatus Babeliales bacterium]
MLKIIKKSLFLSFCACLSVFPMRYVVQAAVTRTLTQSTPYCHSLVARCPFNFVEMVASQVVENAAEGIEKVAVKTVEMTAEAQKTGFQNIDRSVDNKVVLSL